MPCIIFFFINFFSLIFFFINFLSLIPQTHSVCQPDSRNWQTKTINTTKWSFLIIFKLLAILFHKAIDYLSISRASGSCIWICIRILPQDPASGSQHDLARSTPFYYRWLARPTNGPPTYGRTNPTRGVERTFCSSYRGADQWRKPPHEATVWSHHLLESDYKLAMGHVTPSLGQGCTPPPLEPGNNHAKTCKITLICAIPLNHECERFSFPWEIYMCLTCTSHVPHMWGSLT